MIRLLLPLALLATGACRYDNAPEAAPPPPGKCVADGLGSLTGKARSEAVAKEALRLSGAKNLRWIAPGMAVTMDYREDRLNLNVDEKGKILRAHCG
ncbi:I78 family peptidase inhibitor [Sphingomonas psychrotolerans]|uniref:I78 family peptidase inhibitor n=1 Tax=Sphingomonas psychrotolerans TaxID=1327635 RepID=A0ABU3N146_9SPHN|nr:I78 family peptidase inhibitor [Sphingomonas psychrotolerans]MDT8757961.1 I78 family peptidase inhibitor [Sphingomonas psychrotolerans]